MGTRRDVDDVATLPYGGRCPDGRPAGGRGMSGFDCLFTIGALFVVLEAG